jgi:uncharacterized protein (DUF362 family)/Pyruvate/2-oxoacid:ferredoxin oxidoreductase delta subunit
VNSQVAIAKCKDYEPALVQAQTCRIIDLLGGIPKFIKPESRVLVKPNLLMAIEPEFGVDTHPEVVRAVIKVLKGIDCSVFLGDGPSAWGAQSDNINSVYEKSGIKRIAEEEGVSLVRFDKRRWRGKFPLSTWLDDCDYLVSVPKLKTHEFTLMTAAIKNLFGLVSGIYKAELHKKYSEKEGFASIIVDIYQEAKPALTIVDAIIAMEGDGPATGGRLRNTGLLLAGADCVALDSALALIMGIKPFDVLTTKVAAQRGLGIADINSIDILGVRLEEVIQEPFELPASSWRSKIPRPLLDLVKSFIRFYPRVEYANCANCGACIEACPEKLISRKKGKIVIDYSRCISCFCCQEACPTSAIKVKKSILAKLLKL